MCTFWLRRCGGVQLPRILGHFERPGLSALLLSAVPGKPLDQWMSLPSEGLKSLARAFAKLHARPSQPCAFFETVTVRLARARDEIRRGNIDPRQFARRNVHLTPRALYHNLTRQVPIAEQLVVVHGDATLSNVLLDPHYRVGLVDCSHAGCGDPHLDLAPLVEGLREQFGKSAALKFLSAYGRRRWNPEKAFFFSELYELF